MISEEQLQAIKDEATEKYPLLAFWEEDTEKQRKAYIAGATNEALKNESNAVGFAEWLSENWELYNKNLWSNINTAEINTTEELYSLYIKQIK